MNRYGDIKGILNEIDYGLQPLLSRESRKARTKTVGVTSAVGGSGKTSVSMGLARRLADEHKNVLYLNTQEIQSFQYYLENQEPLGKEGCRHLRNVLDEGFEVLRMEFRKEGFTYCPPLRYGREAQTIPFSVYGKIIKEAVETEDYDYIIVDMDNGCNHDNAELLQACDIVLIITLPDDMSAVKTGYLLRNMNCNDFEKYLFVENMCGKQIRRNNTLQERKGRKNEHIEKLQDPVTLEALGHSRGMERLAYMLL